MAEEQLNKKEEIKEKLDYLGLNLDRIPKSIQKFEPLEFRVSKFYDDKQYRQYRYLSIKEIQILLSPTNRMDEISTKYKKASPLYDYLDDKKEENLLKYTTFLGMLKQFKIEEVEKVAQEQEQLNKKVPFKVKYEGNYLWQIYYSENTDQYFMLVPTEDSDYSTFFYLLKKQLEKSKTGKIFVPIRNVGYSNTFLKKANWEDIENYLWLFTKDWPSIYEVYNKKNELTVHIVGETQVYEKIKSPYHIELQTQEQANEFYKLLKAMFILQTELPNYFQFQTNLDSKGQIDFYREQKKFEFSEITNWMNETYEIGEKQKVETISKIEENQKKLEQLKLESVEQEIEYLAKEKQISTFLECKKSFFGKFKYYFKYSKKTNRNKIKGKENKEEQEEINSLKSKTKMKKKSKKENYTIESLIQLYKELEAQENQLKNIVMDMNALKLKNKNLRKKLQNATLFIEEIENHKKSIFEFWRYSNKDEVASLTEGEVEEVSSMRKIDKIFDYEEDLEEFGKKMDRIERKCLSKEEMDSIYLTTTKVLPILNQVKNSVIGPKDLENYLKEMKKAATEDKLLTEHEDFDIFGGMVQDSTKVSKIKNKKHREFPKDLYTILEINKNTKAIAYKLALEKAVENIKNALEKVMTPETIPVYKATLGEELQEKEINVFDFNPVDQIKEAVKQNEKTIYLYKILLKEKTHLISYTNSIFYDNQNRTLPIGQDLSTKLLVDVSKLKLELTNEFTLKIVEFEDQKDDFSEIHVKNIIVREYRS